jgi:hypothetical protein
MGNYWGLTVNNFEILCGKSFVDPATVLLFDKTEYKDGLFTSNCGKIKKRLAILGIDENELEKHYNDCKQKYIDKMTSDDEYIGNKLIKDFTYNDWCKQYKLISEKFKDNYFADKNEVEEAFLESDDYQLCYPTDDIRETLYSILNLYTDEIKVQLDVSELINAGYYKENFDFIDYSIKELRIESKNQQNIILFTEGVFDVFVLKETLHLLYPDLEKYFTFLEFENLGVPGGVSNILAYIKAFSGAKMQDKIIAILDNDAAGMNTMRLLNDKKPNLEDNIKYMTYPVRNYFCDYPTLGPSGEQNLDINKKAASIELYLGDDILKKQEKKYPIQWNGYIKEINSYQGIICNKDEIQKKFKKKLLDCKNNPNHIDSYDWTGIKDIWETIFSICVKL